MLVLPKDATPPNFAEKTVANSQKTLKIAKFFSHKTFPLYSISTIKTLLVLFGINKSIWVSQVAWIVTVMTFAVRMKVVFVHDQNLKVTPLHQVYIEV